jgi:hypothetical protein
MGKQHEIMTVDEVTEIISSVMANVQMSNSNLYSSGSVYGQLVYGSEGCDLSITVDNSTTYQTSSVIFSQVGVMQSVYANIVNSIVTSQSIDSTGLFTPDQLAELQASITNIVSSNITASTITSYTNSFDTSTLVFQGCIYSDDSKLTFTGSQEELISSLSQMYSSMALDQGVSATISNAIDATQDVSSTGILAMILRAIVLIAAIIVVVVGVAAVVLVIIVMKTII